MTLLLTAVLLAIGFTFLAIQNTGNVDIRLGGYVLQGIPLFMIALAAFFFGIFISWILGSIGWISANMSLHKKDNLIHNRDREIQKLQNRIAELENDKATLKNQKEEVIHNRREHDHKNHPNVIDRIRYNLS